MGKALYRKYRSKSFDEVVGQEHITETLKNALKKGAISHAYLFTGPRGVGKTSIARILAYAINDLPYDEEATHLDIIEIDAASNRRIDEIRDLRDKVHIAPTSATYKVYIIDEVHMLTREAFNALLKTLEEPPEHTVFILATTEAHKVPDTIISRTQRFTFKPIKQEDTISHLKEIAKKEKLKLSDEALTLLATHGKGSFRDSISMLDQLAGIATDEIGVEEVKLLLGLPDLEIIETLLNSVASHDIPELFSNVQKLKEKGIDSGKAANAISTTLREQLMNNSLVLPQHTTLALLKELLALSLTTNDYIGLELALMSQVESRMSHKPIAQSETPKKAVTTKPQEPEKEVVEITKEKPQPPEKEIENMPTEPDNELSVSIEKLEASDNTAIWQEMLNAMKKTHNTLYGILRMAKIDNTEQPLQIKFSFGFHKKQIDNPKNIAVLSDYFKKYFGDLTFVTVTDAKAKTSAPAKIAPPAQDSTEILSSVSNIFGGAELLES